jgi:hypothetical protein
MLCQPAVQHVAAVLCSVCHSRQLRQSAPSARAAHTQAHTLLLLWCAHSHRGHASHVQPAGFCAPLQAGLHLLLHLQQAHPRPRCRPCLCHCCCWGWGVAACAGGMCSHQPGQRGKGQGMGEGVIHEAQLGASIKKPSTVTAGLAYDSIILVQHAQYCMHSSTAATKQRTDILCMILAATACMSTIQRCAHGTPSLRTELLTCSCSTTL